MSVALGWATIYLDSYNSIEDRSHMEAVVTQNNASEVDFAKRQGVQNAETKTTTATRSIVIVRPSESSMTKNNLSLKNLQLSPFSVLKV